MGVSFLTPADAGSHVLPTGNLVDKLTIPDFGDIPATLINSGIPTVFVNASDIGFKGTESQEEINSSASALSLLESIRQAGAMAMGINVSGHIPKVAFVAPPADYVASNGNSISVDSVDLLVRAVSMGKLHHAMMGTAAVAIASAAVMPGTLLHKAAGGNASATVTFGHPSGTLLVGAKISKNNNLWVVESVTMNRSARVLMKGEVYLPQPDPS